MAVDRVIVKIVLDFFLLLCPASVLLSLLLWATPYQRGYFEDDLSIRLPYKEQQISELLLALIGFALNVATIIIIEVYRDKQGKSAGEKYLRRSLLPGWVWETYAGIGIFTFGAACQQLTSNAAKYAIGRLRPNFYDVCRPLPNATSPLNALGYIQDFTCTGPLRDHVTESRLSFPSAHSSFAMYSAVFFIMYVQIKGRWRGSKLLRHVVQFAVFMGAWYVGLSRVVDHMHHWSDVAAGFAVGVTYGVLVFIFVLKPKKYGQTSWQTAAPDHVLPRPVMSMPMAR